MVFSLQKYRPHANIKKNYMAVEGMSFAAITLTEEACVLRTYHCQLQLGSVTRELNLRLAAHIPIKS